MSRDYSLYLEDMVQACQAITDYVAGHQFSSYAADRKTVDAVLHNLVVIGEAASKLPESITGRAPEIEWRKIVALRNVVVHEYFGINDAVIWGVVEDRVPILLATCLRLLAEEGNLLA